MADSFACEDCWTRCGESAIKAMASGGYDFSMSFLNYFSKSEIAIGARAEPILRWWELRPLCERLHGPMRSIAPWEQELCHRTALRTSLIDNARLFQLAYPRGQVELWFPCSNGGEHSRYLADSGRPCACLGFRVSFRV